MIGQVTSGPASRPRADQIDAILGEATRRYSDGAVDGLPRAWTECDLIVSHLALGATTRLVAPLLRDKKTDPGVVVIDVDGPKAEVEFADDSVGQHVLAEALSRGPVRSFGPIVRPLSDYYREVTR